jgi:hypothetical protein
MITTNARYTHKIKSRIAMGKASSKRKKALFTNKLYLDLRKRPVKG